MTGATLYQPYEIEWRDCVTFNTRNKRNNFFELIFVVEGTGVQTVNQNKFHYKKGNLFLLTPQDVYSFDIATPTRFFFLRFNESYVSETLGKDKAAVKQVEYILKNASHRPGLSEDAAIIIPIADLANRLIFWDAFSAKYPQHIFIGEANGKRKAYLYYLLAGMDNTPTFDFESKKLRKDFLDAYNLILSKHADLLSATVIKEFVDLPQDGERACNQNE